MRPRVRPLPMVFLAVLTALVGCTAGDSASLGATVSPLADAVSGVCQARAALPDAEAADRAFTNVAHDALHTLAADPGLERELSGRLLEAMEQVEADFDGDADADALEADLAALEAAAGAALDALGEGVPPCAS